MAKTTIDNEISKVEEKISPLIEDLESSATYQTADLTVLQPRPVPNDPLDPLNWSKLQKHSILGIVMALYFMFTYITTATVPSFAELQEQYDLSIEMVNWTVAIPALGLAVGQLFWSSLADIVGRRIIFIVGTSAALVSTIGAAVAPGYSGYMAARFFQGFGVSPAATVGLSIINDLFFEHERGQKVGLWVLAIDLGLYVGPLIGGFIDLVSPAWIQWHIAILFGVILAAEIFFLPETLYPREFMHSGGYTATRLSNSGEKLSPDAGSRVPDTPRTKSLPYLNLKPIPSLKHPKPWTALARFVLMFKFIVIPAAVLVFCFGWYWWILTVVTMLPVAYIDYSPQIQGLFFLGLIIGTLVAEFACSGTLSDKLVVKLGARNNGVKSAEMRLWLVYPAAVLTGIGLIVWGISIDKQYHWGVGQATFFLIGAGIQIGNTAISTYIIDCYPLQSMSIVTFYSVILNLSAFISPFFIAPWVDQMGYTWSFAIQGILCVFFCIPALGAIHYYGPSIRSRNGMPNWLNPEYDIVNFGSTGGSAR